MELDPDISPEELEVFLEEAEEQLQLLEDCAVRLEKTPESAERVQEIFRAVHTIKGSSATIGHKDMARLAHATESMLDLIRKKTLTASPQIIDVFMESLDALRTLKDDLAAGTESGADLSSLISKLEAVSAPKEGPSEDGNEKMQEAFSLNEAERTRLQAAELKGHSPYLVEIIFTQDSPLVAARSLQVLINLAELGEIIRSSPSSSDIEAEKASFYMVILLVTEESIERITKVVVRIPGVASVKVNPWLDEEESVSTVGDAKMDERGADKGQGGPERRVIDLGPEARGRSTEEMLDMAAKKMATTSNTVRIDVRRLDNLMNLAGELVIGRTRLLQVGGKLDSNDRKAGAVGELAETSRHIERVVDELQEEIMKSRLLPVEHVFNKLPRMVRDLARKAGKEIAFYIEGQDTELDRSVIEEIGDPLIHILRNAVDHGIESPEERVERGKPATGAIRLSARNADNQIVVEVADDGKGINAEKMKRVAVQKGIISEEAARTLSDKEAVDLMFAPGLSTADTITDTSGRGVGLDIVKAHISRLNGAIHVESSRGVGTRFILKLPLTVAVIKALLVGLGEDIFALPLISVTEVLRVEADQVHWLLDRPSILLRGSTLPLVGLDEALDLPTFCPRNGNRRLIVVIRLGERRVGLMVDFLIGEQEVVIKSLGGYIGEINGLSGTTILGDGRVALIVDTEALLRRAMALQGEDSLLVKA
ncbi:MAG: chemotaxis protein CheA [Chloroflexota bacterium]